MRKYSLFALITILIVLIGGIYLLDVRTDKNKYRPTDEKIELGEIFSLSDNQSIFYQNVSFTFSLSSLPFSRDPMTGVEQFPVDIYQVHLQYYGVVPTQTPDGSKINSMMEKNLIFHNKDDVQNFPINFDTYSLKLVDTKDEKGYFVLSKNSEVQEANMIKINNYTSKDNSFSFSYPDFASWDSQTPTSDDLARGSIWYNPPESVIWSGPTPEIKITKVHFDDTYPKPKYIQKTNTQNIAYEFMDTPYPNISFYGSDFMVKIEILNSHVDGFYYQEVIDEIVKTFDFPIHNPSYPFQKELSAFSGKPYAQVKKELSQKGWEFYIPKDFTSRGDKQFPEIGGCGSGIDAVCSVNLQKDDIEDHLSVQIGGRPPYGPYREWTVVGQI